MVVSLSYIAKNTQNQLHLKIQKLEALMNNECRSKERTTDHFSTEERTEGHWTCNGEAGGRRGHATLRKKLKKWKAKSLPFLSMIEQCQGTAGFL